MQENGRANVIPTFKEGDLEECIELQANISNKHAGKDIQKQMDNYLQRRNHLSESQHGFKGKISDVTFIFLLQS